MTTIKIPRGLLKVFACCIYIIFPYLCSARIDENGDFFGWVDPDTPATAQNIKAFTTGESDEFEKDGRTFEDGADPMWTAINKSDDDQTQQGKKSLQYYDPTMVTTKGGKLIIKTNSEDTSWHEFNPYKKTEQTMKRHFKSGMIMGWDKFCFTGGILEVSVKLPGSHDVGGLWPAVWLMGNLGRATYEQSTNRMWPWSYKHCDRNLQKAQELSGCDVTAHYALHPNQGRGATEIDIVEVMSGESTPLPFVKNNVKRPYNSMTLQLAPGIPASQHRPYPGTLPEWGFHWYKNLSYGKNTSINPFFYGTFLGPTKEQEPVHRSFDESYQCDAIGSIMAIDTSYYKKFKTFRLEWEPGQDGYVRWYVDGEFRFGIDGKDIQNRTGATIPNEPSYIIMNTAISTSWGFPAPPWGCTEYDCKTTSGRCGMSKGFCESLPAEFHIDSVRVYQRSQAGTAGHSSPSDKSSAHSTTYVYGMNTNEERKGKHTLGCNPQDFPTRSFIKAHEERYIYKDITSKKPIQKGGASCLQTNPKACGGSLLGSCGLFHTCSCNTYWTGPNCLVPAYQNDFADWEIQSEWMRNAIFPTISVSMLVIMFLLAVLLIALLLFKMQTMPKTVKEMQLMETKQIEMHTTGLENGMNGTQTMLATHQVYQTSRSTLIALRAGYQSVDKHDRE